MVAPALITRSSRTNKLLNGEVEAGQGNLEGDRTFIKCLCPSPQEANVWWKIFIGAAALLWGSASMSWAQQSTSQQPPLQRHDPATSGAGPTSGAPGQLNYDPPKDGSVTTDSRGVATTNPKSDNPKTDDVQRDPGNESVGATPRM
jgi:hypothetical protein